MGLTKQSDSNKVFLTVKDFSLWRELKKHVDGCESIEVTNPKTKEVLIKHGYKFRTLEGRAVKLEKYDTKDKYPTRFFGFKLHVQDGAEIFVLEMPYQSQILRRFLRVAPNVLWLEPLSISVFKGKGKEGKDETGIWFQQAGETVKSYYTRETPHGMPPAKYYDQTQEWDFRDQHTWLVARLIEDTMPAIEEAAARLSPPVEPAAEDAEPTHTVDIPPHGEITDDDVPF